MAKKEVNPEEQKLKTRRRLMKLAVYSIPAIATILATKEAYADGTYQKKRSKPGGNKIYMTGLS